MSSPRQIEKVGDYQVCIEDGARAFPYHICNKYGDTLAKTRHEVDAVLIARAFNDRSILLDRVSKCSRK